MKKIGIAIVLLFFCIVIFAHTPLMTIEDNGDGTIYIQGGFSNGASAAGVKLYLTDKASGERVWDGEFPETGEINLKIPNAPYTVTFDAGPGHVIVKDGPEPPGGFGGSAPPANEGGETTAPSEEAKAEEEAPASGGAMMSSAWIPMDTVSAIPKLGPSFVAIIALVVSIINFVLLLFLFKKTKK